MLNSIFYHKKLWAVQFLRIELRPRWKETNGKLSKQRLDKKDRKRVDEMLDYLRLYNSAGSSACRPQLIHPILMSILLEHYKQFQELKKSVETKR